MTKVLPETIMRLVLTAVMLAAFHGVALAETFVGRVAGADQHRHMFVLVREPVPGAAVQQREDIYVNSNTAYYEIAGFDELTEGLLVTVTVEKDPMFSRWNAVSISLGKK